MSLLFFLVFFNECKNIKTWYCKKNLFYSGSWWQFSWPHFIQTHFDITPIRKRLLVARNSSICNEEVLANIFSMQIKVGSQYYLKFLIYPIKLPWFIQSICWMWNLITLHLFPPPLSLHLIKRKKTWGDREGKREYERVPWFDKKKGVMLIGVVFLYSCILMAQLSWRYM